MAYLRDGEVVTRSEFNKMFDYDIADPETNEVDGAERAEAIRQMESGRIIRVGRDERDMHKYRITE